MMRRQCKRRTGTGRGQCECRPSKLSVEERKKGMEKAVLYSETTLYKTGRTAVKTAEKKERDCKNRTEFRSGKRTAGGRDLFKGKKI